MDIYDRDLDGIPRPDPPASPRRPSPTPSSRSSDGSPWRLVWIFIVLPGVMRSCYDQMTHPSRLAQLQEDAIPAIPRPKPQPPFPAGAEAWVDATGEADPRGAWFEFVAENRPTIDGADPDPIPLLDGTHLAPGTRVRLEPNPALPDPPGRYRVRVLDGPSAGRPGLIDPAALRHFP